jgi:hypothetical protein
LERKIKSEKREQTKQPPGPVFLCSAHLPPRQPRFCSLVRLCSVGPTGRHSSRAPDFQPTAFSSVAVVWTQLDFFVEVRPNADQWGLVVRSSPTPRTTLRMPRNTPARIELRFLRHDRPCWPQQIFPNPRSPSYKAVPRDPFLHQVDAQTQT